MRKLIFIALVLALISTASTCRKRATDTVTIALSEKFSTFDTITSTTSDAAAERVKNLMFNALVKKDENFDYVGELAKDIQTSPDGTAITFILQDNVKFHNGTDLSSADVKYTFDQLFESKGYKSGAFFDTVPADKVDAAKAPADAPAANTNANGAVKPAEAPKTKAVPHILSIETPDAKTVVFKIARPSLRNQLLSNLVAVPIIPKDSAARQKDSPMGTGPFKFVSFDASQSIVELAANQEYWEGAPKVPKIRLKTLTDANSLQAELQRGDVDLAPNPNNISPDTIKAFTQSPTLKVEQSDGSNVQYLVFNSRTSPLKEAKLRQAIGYAIDRKKIVAELLFDQAKVADSILPPQSWAYSPGTTYSYDPEKAKQLIKEAGYTGEPIIFKYGSGNLAVNQYAQVIQSSLNEAGFNVQIQTIEANTARKEVAQGLYGIYTGVWIGGNQDPIFLRDLFATSKIPSGTVSCCNRSFYSNPEFDKVVADAENEADRGKAKELYQKAWQIASSDLPLLPLWYPANIVVANKRIGNIKINPSGDWGFIRNITVDQ
ncbi:MAG: ABC transporter substrate-binding protein [Acidobacteria bacterium]|nr:ABC transporter substrate-binding protein [Acidobacteriota bacterium]